MVGHKTKRPSIKVKVCASGMVSTAMEAGRLFEELPASRENALSIMLINSLVGVRLSGNCVEGLFQSQSLV